MAPGFQLGCVTGGMVMLQLTEIGAREGKGVPWC